MCVCVCVCVCVRVCVTKGVGNGLYSKADESAEDVKGQSIDDRRDSTESKTDNFGFKPGVAENQETHNPERAKVCSHVCLGVCTCVCVCVCVCWRGERRKTKFHDKGNWQALGCSLETRLHLVVYSSLNLTPRLS